MRTTEDIQAVFVLEKALHGEISSGGIVVPLIQAGRVIGTLGVSAGERRFTAGVVDVLERLADQTVLAIERAGHCDRLEGELTAHLRLAEELRKSESRFRGAFEVAPIGMALVAPGGLWCREATTISSQ
ncbi:MAG: GAF domain-containing protein [Candidatus Latescibacteria bacterium]|nr:GAF domain-containing protein [Candidatus Latescibacterota bacterium]